MAGPGDHGNEHEIAQPVQLECSPQLATIRVFGCDEVCRYQGNDDVGRLKPR